MKIAAKITNLIFFVMLFVLTTDLAAQEYAPAAVDNPLKGLVPYADPTPDRFPHSMEFSYLKFSDLVVGPDKYDWQPLEKLLNDVKSRGNQTVFRVYLEYPGHKKSLPKFLIDRGLKITRWKDEDGWNETPDYEDQNLRTSLKQFLAALGNKYDGDPRIGYITAGLLGKWGEWHDYPKDKLWASKQTQIEVLDAYESAFKQTPVLLRYPAKDKHYDQAPNHKRKFGYHDDSFAFGTMNTGREDDSWFFQHLLMESGTTERWKTQPIGGEVRPEVWGCCFDPKPCTNKGQSFAECRDATHVTWLMESGMFENQASPERLNNAKVEVRKMGYEFHIQSVSTIQKGDLCQLSVKVKNTGIAPFYHSGWTIKIKNLKSTGNPFDTKWELTGILPGQTKVFQVEVPSKSNDKFLIGVPNPMEGGKPIRFANKKQDADQNGWLTIESK